MLEEWEGDVSNFKFKLGLNMFSDYEGFFRNVFGYRFVREKEFY